LESLSGVLNAIKQPKMLTVSMRSRPAGELALAVASLWDAFSRLRHRSIWKSVKGAIVSLEITYNGRDRSWHPHLHIVLESDYIPWSSIHAVWVEVSRGEGNAVYIQKCRPGWERELIKYITKVADLLKDKDAFREFLRVTQNKRFIRTYGTLYNARMEGEPKPDVPVCSGCGAVMFLEAERVKVEIMFGGRFDESIIGGENHGCECHSPP
jgi:Replication protein